MPSLSRRSFLALGGGLVVAAACSNSSGEAEESDQGLADPEALTAGLVSIDPYQSTEPQRLGFVVFHNNGDFAAGPSATVALKGPGDASFSAPISAELHAEGLPDRRGIYVVEVALPTAGIWDARLVIDGERIGVPFQVAANSDVVIPGQPAPRAASPTFTETLGVDPICTRIPPCPLHTVSLSDVIGNGTPVAVMFGTPARCETRYCGPVLDQLLDVLGNYGTEIQFVHVEIFQNSTTDEVVSTIGFEPGGWALPGEPWLFGIDGGGNIVNRLDGAFGTDEVTALLDQLR